MASIFSRGKFQLHRREQHLRERLLRLQGRHHALQQNAFVGSVLVDQVHAVRPLGHDIALRKLPDDAQGGNEVSCPTN